MESEGQTRHQKARALTTVFFMWLSLCVGSFAISFFGSNYSGWLRPGTGMLPGMIAAVYVELTGLRPDLMEQRAWVTFAVAWLAYLVSFSTILEYRLPHGVPQVLPWDRSYTMAFGVAVFAGMVFRAIWLFRRRLRSVSDTTDIGG